VCFRRIRGARVCSRGRYYAEQVAPSSNDRIQMASDLPGLARLVAAARARCRLLIVNNRRRAAPAHHRRIMKLILEQEAPERKRP